MPSNPGACAIDTPTVRSRSRSLRVVGLTLALWLAAAGLAYLSAPLMATSWWFGLLFALFALFAVVALPATSLGLVIFSLAQRAWLRAAAVALVAACGAVVIYQVNWQEAFVRHQVAWHHDDLNALAAAYDRGEVREGHKLPWSLRLLSSDDVAHVWSVDRGDDLEPSVLFIQTWQDWRAESGVGLAYLPAGHDTGAMVRTAEGDGGHATRALGGGWWRIE
jgi:hypothetical protein